MIKIVCTVFDSKAKTFCNPFYSTTRETAIRDFSTAVNDPSSDLSRYPEDYALYVLGEFDDSTGAFHLENPINLGLASLFRKE